MLINPPPHVWAFCQKAQLALSSASGQFGPAAHRRVSERWRTAARQKRSGLGLCVCRTALLVTGPQLRELHNYNLHIWKMGCCGELPPPLQPGSLSMSLSGSCRTSLHTWRDACLIGSHCRPSPTDLDEDLYQLAVDFSFYHLVLLIADTCCRLHACELELLWVVLNFGPFLGPLHKGAVFGELPF